MFPIQCFVLKRSYNMDKLIKNCPEVSLTSLFKIETVLQLNKLKSFVHKQRQVLLYINLACLFVCLCPINVKTAEPIGPKFFVGHLETPGKVYESSKFQIFVSIKIRSSLNFLKF